MNTISISVEEAVMLEAMKTIRKVTKDKTISFDEKTNITCNIIKKTNEALDILDVE